MKARERNVIRCACVHACVRAWAGGLNREGELFQLSLGGGESKVV